MRRTFALLAAAAALSLAPTASAELPALSPKPALLLLEHAPFNVALPRPAADTQAKSSTESKPFFTRVGAKPKRGGAQFFVRGTF